MKFIIGGPAALAANRKQYKLTQYGYYGDADASYRQTNYYSHDQQGEHDLSETVKLIRRFIAQKIQKIDKLTQIADFSQEEVNDILELVNYDEWGYFPTVERLILTYFDETGLEREVTIKD